jgi:glycosyltransferase involved in cell wall biosynthesis
MSEKSSAAGGPLVSVIVPAFNVAAFIEQSVNSILAQTHAPLEVIIVDDGSNDDTCKIVRQIPDDRVKMIHKENGGCASARNAGVAVSSGEFIAFLDGDDYWLPNMLERQLAHFEAHPGADMIFCLSMLVDVDDNREGIMKYSAGRNYSFQDILVENPVGNGSAAVFRREALESAGPFDESLPASSDYDMWLRIAKLKPDNFICLPETLVCYRRRLGQTTSDWLRMETAHEMVVEKFRQQDPAAVAAVEGPSQCHWNRYLAFIAYEVNELSAARHFLRKSMAASRSTFLLDIRSWLLTGAVASKAILPARLHAALSSFFLAARQALFAGRARLANL